MAKPPSDYDQDILDIIPERFEVDEEIIEEDNPPFWRRHLPLALGVVVVGGLVAAVLSFSDPPSNNGGNVPTITADTTAPRIRPADPGGMEVPDQDKLVYGGSDSAPSSERLLPPPEAPKPLPPAPAVGPNEPPLPQAAPTTSVERLGGTGAGAMKPPQVAVVTPPPPAPLPLPVPPAVAPAPVPQAPAAPPAKAEKPVAAKPAVDKPVAVTGGNSLIQLGALRSQADADKEWKRIQKANSDLLSGLSSDIIKADLPNGTFWRLRAGPVSEDSAKKLCAELKKRNQGCIIAKK